MNYGSFSFGTICRKNKQKSLVNQILISVRHSPIYVQCYLLAKKCCAKNMLHINADRKLLYVEGLRIELHKNQNGDIFHCCKSRLFVLKVGIWRCVYNLASIKLMKINWSSHRCTKQWIIVIIGKVCLFFWKKVDWYQWQWMECLRPICPDLKVTHDWLF